MRKRWQTLVLTLGVAGYFWWDANRQKQAADKAQTEATDALLKFKNGQAAKAMLEIKNLRERGEVLLKNQYFQSAKEMYQQADTLAQEYPEIPDMQREHRELTE